MTAIDDFFTHYYGRRPVNATFTGVHAYDDRLPDWSADGLARMDDEMASLGAALAREYPAPASAGAFRNSPDLLDAELARGFLEIQRAENASLHGPCGNPSLWIGEAIFSIISLMIRDFASSQERVESAIARLDQIPSFLERGRHSERSEGSLLSGSSGVSTVTPRIPRFARNDAIPRVWAEKTLRECQGAEILLSAGIARWLASAPLAPEVVTRVRELAERALSSVRTFVSALATHPDAPESALACGPELYDLLLTHGHFCTRSRDELLAEARDGFDAERAQLDTMVRDIAGSWEEAQAQLAADHPLPNDYLGAFAETWRECQVLAEAQNVVSWPDKWPIRYVQFPEWTADAAPYLYYLYYRSPAPFDGYTTYDYVVPPLPADRDKTEQHLRVWNNSTIKLNHVVHHGAIGHHVQNWYAYNQQRSRVGTVAGVDCANRIGMFLGGTMTEGWACYATDLMEELAFLTPLERVSQQHTRVRMLARAIVDIELHQGSMSFSQAVQFYAEHVGMSPDAARAEATKNSMYPCTAIMYWLGAQGIHQLRAEMQRREGPRFSLRRFHGELLGYGSVPVPLVARMMTDIAFPGQ